MSESTDLHLTSRTFDQEYTNLVRRAQANRTFARRNYFSFLPHSWRYLPTIIGGILIHLTLGTMYSMGNMIPYIASYLKIRSGESGSYSSMSWLISVAVSGQGLSFTFGGLIEKVMGPRLTSIFGGTIASCGVLLTYFSIQKSFVATLLTYSLLFGLGVGFAYSSPLVCLLKWMPHRKGLASGLIVFGYGCGALIFNQVQTAYINPHNIQPNLTIDGQKYFDEPDILDKVPSTFLLLAGCYLAMQLIGSFLIADPPMSETDSTISSHPLINDLEDDEDDLEAESDLPFEKEFKPLEVISSTTFAVLWLTFLLNGQLVNFINSYWKSFGQTFILDDRFLAVTGSLSAVANAFGRIAWGSFADRYSYRVLCSTTWTAVLSLGSCRLITVHFGKSLYFIWVLGIFFTFSGTFSLLPMAVAQCFGQKNVGVNYGLLFTSQILTSVISGILAQTLVSRLHYTGMFYILSAFASMSLLLSCLVTSTKFGHSCGKSYV